MPLSWFINENDTFIKYTESWDFSHFSIDSHGQCCPEKVICDARFSVTVFKGNDSVHHHQVFEGIKTLVLIGLVTKW